MKRFKIELDDGNSVGLERGGEMKTFTPDQLRGMLATSKRCLAVVEVRASLYRKDIETIGRLIAEMKQPTGL